MHGASSRLPAAESEPVVGFTSGGGGGLDGLLGLISSTFSAGISNCNAMTPNDCNVSDGQVKHT